MEGPELLSSPRKRGTFLEELLINWDRLITWAEPQNVTLEEDERRRVRLQAAIVYLCGFYVIAGIIVTLHPYFLPYQRQRFFFSTFLVGFAFYMGRTKYYSLVFFTLTIAYGLYGMHRTCTFAMDGEYLAVASSAITGTVTSALIASFVMPLLQCFIVLLAFYGMTVSLPMACPAVEAAGFNYALTAQAMCFMSVLAVVLVQRRHEWYIRMQSRQLRGAKEKAEEASRLKSTFVATMSHEIRTPLNGILGLTRLLLDTPLSSMQHDWVQNVQTSGKLLMALANQVLDFARIESGKIDLEHTPFNLRATVDEVVRVCGVSVTDGVDVVCHIARDVPTHVIGDPLRLQQVLVNILGNAGKFTKRGYILLECSVARTPRPPPLLPQSAAVSAGSVSQDDSLKKCDDQRPPASAPPATTAGGASASSTAASPHRVALHFAVRDSGIGISAEMQKRIFEPFTQADSSNTRRYGGAGLGLAISDRLARLMDGRIGVAASEPGVGTEFVFDAVLEVDESAERMVMQSQRRCADTNILLSCTNPVVESTLTAILEQNGATVSSVYSGAQPEAADLRPEEIVARIVAAVSFHAEAALDIPGGQPPIAVLNGPHVFAVYPQLLPLVGTTVQAIVVVASIRDPRCRLLEDVSGVKLVTKPIVADNLIAAVMGISSGASSRRMSIVSAATASAEAGRAPPAFSHNIFFSPALSAQSPGSPLASSPVLSHINTTSVSPLATFPNSALAAAKQQLRVLAVDDYSVNQLLVRVLLQKLGYAVDVAENGQQAFEMVVAAASAGAPYSVVLMDLQMPVMDGYESTRCVRRWEAEHALRPAPLAATASVAGAAAAVAAGSGGDDGRGVGVSGDESAGAATSHVPSTAQASLAAEAAADTAVAAEESRAPLAISPLPACSNDVLPHLDLSSQDQQPQQQQPRQRQQPLRRVPIIALSATADPAALAECAAAGMDDLLAKPLSFSELSAKMARWAA